MFARFFFYILYNTPLLISNIYTEQPAQRVAHL